MINKKVRNANVSIYNDIKFKSNLELFCYKKLKENNIEFIYQPEPTILLDSFDVDFQCYEDIGKIYRDENKKILNSTKRFDLVKHVRAITYTPDFIGVEKQWIIETKGFANDSFPLKWKLFKDRLVESGFNGLLLKPENQREILQCVELIKEIK